MSLMLGATTMLGDTGYDGPNNVITVVDVGLSGIGVRRVDGQEYLGDITPNQPKQGLWIRLLSNIDGYFFFDLRNTDPDTGLGGDNLTLATRYHVRSVSVTGTFAGGAPDRTVTYVVGDAAGLTFTQTGGYLAWIVVGQTVPNDVFVVGNSYEVVINYEEFVDFTLYAGQSALGRGFVRGSYGSIAPDLPIGGKLIRTVNSLDDSSLVVRLTTTDYTQDFLGAITLRGRFKDAPTVDQVRLGLMSEATWLPSSNSWGFIGLLDFIAGNTYQVRIYLNG